MSAMKRSYRILIILLTLSLLVGGVQATFSAWSYQNGCWTATDGTYNLTMFNATGTYDWPIPEGVTILDRYLVQAPGGSGGHGGTNAGGAGAGGFLNGTNLAISGKVIIKIGRPGPAQPTATKCGTSGGNTNITIAGVLKVDANGGGYGGGNEGGSGDSGGPGGSGGGAYYAGTGGTGTAGQGTNGGNGNSAGGSSGGGNQSAGLNADSMATGKEGGAGICDQTMTGVPLPYAAGGGSSGTSTGGLGGSACGKKIGGDGSSGDTAGTAGALNTGSGGGAVTYSGTTSGAGGGGIVMFKYLLVSSSTTYTNAFPVANTTDYVKATSSLGDGTGYPYFATNTSLSLTGSYGYNSWLATTATNQRFHIDLGSPLIIRRIYYENAHHLGGSTNWGAKNLTFWGTNSAIDFANVTYGNSTLNWTQISTNNLSFIQHTDTDAPDPDYILADNNGAYRYYAVTIPNSWGSTQYIGLRRIVLQTEDNFVVTTPVSSFTSQNATASIARNSTSRGWEGYAPFTMVFNDTSTNTPTLWSWSYQGYGTNTTSGVFSTLRNTSSTFAAGNFTIALNATNEYGSNISVQNTWINISVGTPVASFTTTNTSVATNTTGRGWEGVSPFTMQFTDTSLYQPTSWAWGKYNLTLGTWTLASTAQNPAIVLTTGNWTINLTATNSAGSGISAQELWINVTAPSTVIPIVQFITDKTTVLFPERIYFNDTSLNAPTTWNWSFGDGTWYNTTSASLGLNKTYYYTKRGEWIANLTVSNEAGSNTSASHSKTIRVIGYQGLVPPVTGGICEYSVSRVLDMFERMMTDCKVCGIHCR